ncbi:MAG: hypothetical protein R3B84_09725 [Zavarzinella sp.]
MAKKTQKSGKSSPFLIIMLVLFILTTIAASVTTYMGFDGQAQFEKQAQDAEEAKKGAQAAFEQEKAKRILTEVAIGAASEQDRTDLVGLASSQSASILEQHTKIVGAVKGSLPNANDFDWPLVNTVAAGGNPAAGAQIPDVAPKITIPALVKQWSDLYRAKETSERNALDAQKTAENQKIKAEADLDAQRKIFQDGLANLQTKFEAFQQETERNRTALFAGKEKDGDDYKKKTAELQQSINELGDDVAKLQKDIRARDEKINRLENKSDTDIEERFRKLDVTRVEENKGEITTKDGDNLVIRFNTRLALVPGQTFLVTAPSQSLAAVIDREKVLQRANSDRGGLERIPFDDNELVKGKIEIIEVTGPFTARALITEQLQPIRNPVSKGDTLFNIILSNTKRTRVSFAGVIDLDGDGTDDSQEFIRILEKNNTIVDSYLDLRTGTIKGPGMSLSTNFLIMANDAPAGGNFSKMEDQAKKLGVQMIDARRFLVLIGVKLPKNPLPANYGVNSGGVPMEPVDPNPEGR